MVEAPVVFRLPWWLHADDVCDLTMCMAPPATFDWNTSSCCLCRCLPMSPVLLASTTFCENTNHTKFMKIQISCEKWWLTPAIDFLVCGGWIIGHFLLTFPYLWDPPWASIPAHWSVCTRACSSMPVSSSRRDHSSTSRRPNGLSPPVRCTTSIVNKLTFASYSVSCKTISSRQLEPKIAPRQGKCPNYPTFHQHNNVASDNYMNYPVASYLAWAQRKFIAASERGFVPNGMMQCKNHSDTWILECTSVFIAPSDCLRGFLRRPLYNIRDCNLAQFHS